jgi:nitrite reductase/ring-hydroxylating ferredoxin subunit
MTIVILLMLVSLAVRWWGGLGVHGLAVTLSTVGWLVALVGAYLGGHLVYGIGSAVNRNAFATPPEDWVEVGTADAIADGHLLRADAAGTPVLLTRIDGRLEAIAAVCSHAGGPLDEGTLEGDVVTCPWHGSRFSVRDGRVCGGPANFAQPAFEVRERVGRVEVRPAG